MKIYIHTDLEGITGIDGIDGLVAGDSPRRGEFCENLMADLNAAVAGAFDGGATHVTVLDSHGGGGNFILDMLDDRAENDIRQNKKWWGKLDDSYGGTMFIGAHAMAGTINGFLDHTQSSREWFNYYINGRKCGELAQWAAIAGKFGVPMLMVSGDEAGCAEARAFFGPIETVAVKQGVGRQEAILYDADENRERIRAAAARSISLVGKAKPFCPLLPMEVKLEFCRSDHGDRAASQPGVERLDARTVRKIINDPLELLFY